MIRTYKYRLYPSRSQETNLWRVLDACRGLYNMALAERKVAYQMEGHRLSKAELYELGKHYRQTFPYADQVFSQTAQSVIEQVDLAFQAFFRRVKAGERPGYPRFKGRNHYHSFLFKQFSVGARLDGRRLKLFGIGRVRVRWHRPLEGAIRTVRMSHKAGEWYACFACEIEEPDPLPATGQGVGVDVGLSALLTTSDGEKVAHPAYYRAGQQRLRVLQRKLARTQRGSQKPSPSAQASTTPTDACRPATRRLPAQTEHDAGGPLRQDRTGRPAGAQYGSQPPPEQEHSRQRLVCISAVSHLQS